MRCIVAGGGVAGLTIAAALDRLRPDLDVRILDERPEPGSGAALTLWPAVLRALDRIGLGDAVRDLGAPVASATIRRSDGRVIHDPSGGRLLRILGEPARSVARAELHELLMGRSADRLHTGHAVEQVRLDERGADVTVSGAAGRSQERADLLIGADGWRSVVARAIDPHVTTTGAGYAALRGVAGLEVDPAFHCTIWGRRWEAGIVPMTAARTYWFATIAVDDAEAESACTAARIVERMRRAGEPWTALLDAAGALDRPLAVYDRTVPKQWVSGTTVLIGDAAQAMQPTLGQGAGQSIIDAVTLADVRTPTSGRPIAVWTTRWSPGSAAVADRSRPWSPDHVCWVGPCTATPRSIASGAGSPPHCRNRSSPVSSPPR